MARRTVKEILNLPDGKFFDADDILNRPEDEVFLERRKLEEAAQRKEKTLVCAICQQALKIRGDSDGTVSIHFAHLYDSGDCPIKTGQKYTQDEILRMKYNGVKESPLHIKLKNAIARAIGYDARFSAIRVDETFKSEGLSKEWKKPDVSAKFHDDRIVFEVQLSTTFLSVIVQREVFYRERSTYIMWLFNEFSTDAEAQKFTEKDIIYSNNNNAFVINDETIELSENAGKFLFFCHYRKPFLTDCGSIDFVWERQLISFDDIKFDLESFKVYYFDSKAEKERLQAEAERQFREEFEEAFLTRHPLSYEERRSRLGDIEGKFAKRGIGFSSDDDSLHKILDAIYSLEKGRIIGYNYTNFISLANLILEFRKEYAELFLLALRHFGIEEKVLEEDKKGSFRNKLSKMAAKPVPRNRTYDPLFQHLFPALPIQEDLP
jgi:competence CoiA-like predicted nuclease